MNENRIEGWIFLTLAVVCSAFLLAGCTVPGRGCPDVVEYSADFTAAFKEQYRADIPAGSPVDTFIIDAYALRKEARACAGE